MASKYELVSEDFIDLPTGIRLYRVRALINFGSVTAGDLGGYIESESNLSHLGLCWVAGSARVFSNATVIDDAVVSGGAKVYDSAIIRDFATVNGYSAVYGSAVVEGTGSVTEDARVYGSCTVTTGGVCVGNYRQATGTISSTVTGENI